MNNDKIRDLIQSLGIFLEPEHYDIARVIIQECIKCCEEVDDAEYGDYEPPDIATGIRDGALLCKIEIKEHFGVK